jgi:hypothetical protein
MKWFGHLRRLMTKAAPQKLRASRTEETTMPTGEKIEGPFSKPYELWLLDSKKEKYERLAAGDTIEELYKDKPRLNYLTAIYHNGKLVEKKGSVAIGERW